MSTSSPGRRLNSRCCNKMVKKRNTSHRPMDSPMQRLFPKPKVNTLSLSILFISVPAALRNRSGLKAEGSFQSFLEQKGDRAEGAVFTHGNGESSQKTPCREKHCVAFSFHHPKTLATSIPDLKCQPHDGPPQFCLLNSLFQTPIVFACADTGDGFNSTWDNKRYCSVSQKEKKQIGAQRSASTS